MAITVRPGRWGLARIVELSPRDFTTAAHVERLGPVIEGYYPPMNAEGTAYALPFALVRFPLGVTGTPSNDVRLFPSLTIDRTLGDLTPPQRTALRNRIEEWLTEYSYVDFDLSPKVVARFSGANFDASTSIIDILRAIYTYLGHSDTRTRVQRRETHNTEYLDDFSTDPFSAPRWTNVRGTAVWDSMNSEMDMDQAVGRNSVRYSANNPGSIEHEAQATFLHLGGTNSLGGGACRFDSGGAQDFYLLTHDVGTDDAVLRLHVGGGVTTLTTFTDALLAANGDWLTFRLAASGAAGANVVLNAWLTNHGASKPSDPGWLGVDGTPMVTYTDTSVNRLDATNHIQCGMACGGVGIDADARHSFFKQRAISDRSGGVTHYTLTADAGAVVITGTSAGLRASRRLAADSGSISLVGTAVSLRADRRVIAESGAITVTGTAVGLRASRRLAAESGSIALSGTVANLRAARRLIAESGAIFITGVDANLIYDAAESQHYTLIAESGAVIITGTSAVLRAGRRLVAAPGDVVIVGTDTVLRTGRRLVAAPGSISLEGSSAALLAHRRLIADSGSILLTGFPAELLWSGVIVSKILMSGAYTPIVRLEGSYTPVTKLTGAYKPTIPLTGSFD